MKFKFAFLFAFLFSINSFGQFLDDLSNREITIKGLDYLYNFQFEQAEETLKPVKKQYANHPVSYLLNAIQMQWQYLPIDKNPTALKRYVAELEKCVSSAKVLVKDKRYKKEAIFYLLASHGFIALAHNYKKDYLAAAAEAKRANDYFNEGKKYKNENAEFTFAAGIYDYYRVQYPETHPIVKPVMMFFEQGNKKTGLAELEYASKNSIFSRTEASSYLTNIYIKYEANFKKAYQYSSELAAKYPNNFIFKIRNIECLLLNKNFEAAAAQNAILSNRKDAISDLSNLVFEGYLEQYYRKNNTRATLLYAKALKIAADERYTSEYHGLAYLGLARIFAAQNDKEKAKAFYKRTLDVAEYHWVVNAAKTEIKDL